MKLLRPHEIEQLAQVLYKQSPGVAFVGRPEWDELFASDKHEWFEFAKLVNGTMVTALCMDPDEES